MVVCNGERVEMKWPKANSVHFLIINTGEANEIFFIYFSIGENFINEAMCWFFSSKKKQVVGPFPHQVLMRFG